ncbi:MAG: PD40 domain-containing protein [Chloroflexi bacterium]|nr:PD40 domain-containing protein [Chloroflexota bacterium]
MRTSLLIFSLLLLAVVVACGGDGEGPYTSDPSGRIAFSSERDGNREIYVMSADGSGVTNISQHAADDTQPSWAPAGDRIAFIANRGRVPDIYVMEADGGNVERITEDPAVEALVRWSPDGERIAFSSGRDQSQGFLWVANADGSEAFPLLAAITPSGPEVACAGGFPASWFPDGETILYRGSQGGIEALQICSVKDDGSEIEIIFSEENVSSDRPSLSPDGQKIAFISNSPANFEVFVMTSSGADKQRLTVDPGGDLDPVWSPDGQWIAFSSERDGDYDIYIMRPDGSDLRQLTDAPGADRNPNWVP